MANWILACKELNGTIYLSRLPQSQPGPVPGTPDMTGGQFWFPVGPGLRPSIQEYNTNQFILTFDYLSHLFTRVIGDVNVTWPPTTVQPIQISGGPNPPNPIEYNIQLATDALTLNTASSEVLTTFAVSQFYNPPIIQFPLLFLDPATTTYSVTLQPVAGYIPSAQTPYYVGAPVATTTPYFRLYARPFPYTGAWELIQDWTIINNSFPWFSFLFSNVGSLRYQFSVVWGNQFNFAKVWDPTQHQGGAPGITFITVDSNVLHPSAQAVVHEPLTIYLDSSETFGIFSPRQSFFVEAPTDVIRLSRSLLGQGSGDAFGFFGTRQGFINETSAPGDQIKGFSFSEASKGGNAFGAFDVRT